MDRLSVAIPARTSLRPGAVAGVRPPSRQLALAELGRRLVLDGYAPAAVLINQANACVFSLGPTDRYLRMAPGHPTHELLAMVQSGLRTKLRTAIDRARRDMIRISVECRAEQVVIEVRPVLDEGEALLLVCFLPAPPVAAVANRATTLDPPQVAELERELETTRSDLQVAVSELELSAGEQKAVNEEASSVNAEFQSANQELLASKAALQSLNQELTALNTQLQQTLERAADNGGRPAERALQHERRDPVPRPRSPHPLLHARHAVVVRHSSGRCRPSARRPSFPRGRRCVRGRRHRRAGLSRPCGTGDRGRRRPVVPSRYPAVSRPCR